MNMWKFLLSLIAASITATSQLTLAAMVQGATQTTEQQQKKELNEILKDPMFQGKETFNELYKAHRGLMDSESQSLTEGWLANFGQEKLPAAQAQIVKDKNGQNVLKLSLTKFGQSTVIQFNIDDENSMTINGQSVSLSDLRHAPSLIRKLAANDSQYKDLEKTMKSSKPGKPQLSGVLTTKEFLHLPKEKKIEYMALLRESLEAAQNVVDLTRGHSAETELRGSSYVLNPLFASLIAQASDVNDGDKCLAAGSITIYVNGSCSPFPSQDALKKYQPSLADSQNQMASFHTQCASQAGGLDVACNPLVYGLQGQKDAFPGQPYCLQSTKQPDFTNKATVTCDSRSPLPPEADIAGRKAAYKHILESYYAAKGGKAEDLKNCFNAQNEINTKCASLFQPQIDSFGKFKTDVETLCHSGTLTRQDQQTACTSLMARNLELELYTEKCREAQLIQTPIQGKENCEKIKATWNESNGICYCGDGQMADKNNDENPTFSCPAAAAVDVGTKPEKKERCKNDDGSKKTTFSCGPGPWIIAGIGILALWLFSRHHKNPKGTPPIHGGGSTTTTTLRPVAPSEGGSGTAPVGSGGTR